MKVLSSSHGCVGNPDRGVKRPGQTAFNEGRINKKRKEEKRERDGRGSKTFGKRAGDKNEEIDTSGEKTRLESRIESYHHWR